MITHVHIKDFAIIEEIDVDLRDGLNIITGETGAGKSIIIEAISMALGARADRSAVRAGAGKALIQILIDEGDLPETRRTGIEILSREISPEGKSICRIDGEIVTLARLKEATARIADIHGQYDHQSLLDPENHIGVIDDFRADYIAPARARVADAYRTYVAAERQLNDLCAAEAASRRELDFLRFEVNEIDAAKLRPGEYDEMKERVRVMQNSERIYEALSTAYEALAGGQSAVSAGLSSAVSALKGVSEISGEYKTFEETASDAYYTLEELARHLRDRRDGMDFSEHAINEAIARLDTIDRLIVKYGAADDDANDDDPIERVLRHRDHAVRKLENIEFLDEKKTALTEARAHAKDALSAESLVLSRFRRKAAEELEVGIVAQLQELNFTDAVFTAHFARSYGMDDKSSAIDPSDYTENGVDRVEFLLSANKGQPPLPVAKIASGGEMSRIMLALKSVIGEFDAIPTMIFDEIDAGISGVTASIVGEKLSRMAGSRQILCITHLPQIAAFADRHYIIEKRSDDAKTYTTVRALADEERVTEIARLIGGSNVTKTTLESARELIAASAGTRQAPLPNHTL